MSTALSNLCQSCGLCCDGTLFAFVPLKAAEEEAAARSLSLPLFDRDNGVRAFSQPCQLLKGASCGAYDQRPEACRKFFCNVYAAVADDEVDVYDALEVIDQAHEKVADLAVTFDLEAKGGVMNAARRKAAYDPTVTDDQKAALKKTERFLDRYFLGRK